MKSENEVAQSCLTLRGPMDCSLPGSSVHGIFQARVLEWGAIAFSEVDPELIYFHIHTKIIALYSTTVNENNLKISREDLLQLKI